MRSMLRDAVALALLAGCGALPGPLSTEKTAGVKTTVAPTDTAPSPASTMPPTATGTNAGVSPLKRPASPAPAPSARPTPEMPSLEVQIGQMLMVGFRGLSVDEEHFIVQDIRQRHLGGVVLFDYDIPSGQPVRNVESPAQLKLLITSLQSVARLPLLVAMDHEGGLTTRLTEAHGFPATLSHQQLGALGDLERTYTEATLIAKTLGGLGINLNLAPVVDLCANPDNPIIAKYERCFSADPHVTTAQALAFIRAHHVQGIGCTLKHFPGHGSSQDDSHHGMTDVTETWTQEELLPYTRIIERGQADAIMTAHVFNAHLDDAYPATLSRATITGLLRDKLGYEGVVISDDLQMRAITDEYGFETVVQRAIEAGVDVLAFANNRVYEPDVAARAVSAIQDLVKHGVISEGRITASYRRIQALKQKFSRG